MSPGSCLASPQGQRCPARWEKAGSTCGLSGISAEVEGRLPELRATSTSGPATGLEPGGGRQADAGGTRIPDLRNVPLHGGAQASPCGQGPQGCKTGQKQQGHGPAGPLQLMLMQAQARLPLPHPPSLEPTGGQQLGVSVFITIRT